MVKLLAPVVLAFGLAVAGPVSAATPEENLAILGADTELWSGLFALAVADEIRNNCPTIEARTLRATAFVYGLYRRARGYGFTRQELRAFQVHETTGTRMRAEVGVYFAQHGVREGVPDTYCALGLAEIAAGSQAGEILRAR